MRVDQDRVTRNAGNLRIGDGLVARGLGRNRKCNSKIGDGNEQAESAQGKSFQNRLSLNNSG
jgi:hypothetical protein